MNISESPGFGDALSAFCQNVKNLCCKVVELIQPPSMENCSCTYDHPAGNVPTADANLAIQSGFWEAKVGLLPVQDVHQEVVV